MKVITKKEVAVVAEVGQDPESAVDLEVDTQIDQEVAVKAEK